MKDAARAAFVPMTIAFEGGYIDWLFPDVKKLISTGFGLLMNSPSLYAGLPWRLPDGSLASRDEIIAQWARLKNFIDQNPGSELWSYKRFALTTTIRLGRDGLDHAVQGKLNQNELVLRNGFPDWDSWPADAQLATMSMAWACGPAFYSPSAGRNYWPRLTAALRDRDFANAAIECFMNEEKENPGIIPRNKANRTMYLNAAFADGHLDPEQIYWPRNLESGEVDREAPTLPEFQVVPGYPPPLESPELDDSSPPPPPDDEPPPAAA